MEFLAFCFDYLKSSKNFKHLSETEQRGTPYFYAECNVAQLRAGVDVKNLKSFYCFLLDFIREIDILANVFVQSNINTFGNDAMAGCGTYSKLEGFAFLPVTCFTMALTTFVGQNLGAKQYELAKKGSRFGIICSVVLAEIIGIILFIFMPYLAKLFTDDPEVIAISVKQARTITLFYFLLAFSHCVAAILRGAGKAIIPMLIMLVVWCVIRVAYISIALSFIHEIRLVFIAYPLTWGISSIIYLFYYIFGDWVHGFEKKTNKQFKIMLFII